MKDNCIENHVTGSKRGGQPWILIADPEGNLKLVKWRLRSDGYNILYTNDVAAIEALIGQNNVLILMVNVSNTKDLNRLKEIKSIRGNYDIIALTSSRNTELKKQIFAAGVRKIINKPVDFPSLSLTIKEEITKAAEKNFFTDIAFREQGGVPLGFLSAYKMALDHVKTAVLITDSSGVIMCANRPMTLLLQMNEGSILQKHYREITADLAGGYQVELLGILQRAIETLEICSTNEVVVSNGTEPVLSIEAEAHPVFDSRGNLKGAFLAAGEISGYGRLEAQREKLAMVGQLAAGAVHEIKNPLTSVRGFIQLLQNEAEGSPKAEYLDIIISEIDRVNNIVNEFLKLAKPTQPNRKSSDLRELWEDIRVLIESEAFLLDVNIVEDFSELTKLVSIDSEQIKQVLINVIRNSFEAMAGGGELTIRLYELSDEQKVCLQISDNGIGMDEETVRRIFVPFFTTKDYGTGLGLAVSSTIMENHGGSMEVKSKEGNGTTIFLYFPCE